jgi:hypothetical protein
MKNPTPIVSTAILISASLALAACESEVSIGEGLGDANQSICAHGQFNMFIDNQDLPQLVALKGGSVWWYNQGITNSDVAAVMHVPESGGAPITVAKSENIPLWATPSDIIGTPLLDDTNVYWVRANQPPNPAGGTWSMVTVPQGGGAQTTLFTSAENVGELVAVDSENFYFANAEFQQQPVLSRAVSIPKTGGPATLLSTYTGGWSLGQVLTDDTNLYFIDGDTSVSAASKPGLYSMPKGGGTPTLLVAQMAFSSNAVLSTAVLDNDRIYLQYTNGVIVSVEKSGGTVDTLSTAELPPYALASDDACLYWSSQIDHVLYAMPKAGGQVIAAADTSEVHALSGLLADASGVYISDVNGFLSKLSR